MMHQLLGPEKFRRGTDLYFERHDGDAVTCEDFVVALEEASGCDLAQFRRWYSQSGTPVLEVSDSLILAQQAEHFPITKAIYSLLSTLGNGHELAAALGVWAMIFLGISIMGAFVILGKRGGSIFRM